MQIIGHRGAPALAPDNTLAGIKAAIKTGVDAVEFDVRRTLDNQLVLQHDGTLERTAGDSRKISELTLDELSRISTKSGELIPSLSQALLVCGDTSAVIEAKGGSWAPALAKALNNHEFASNVRVIAFDHEELSKFHEMMPQIKTWALVHNRSGEALHLAQFMDFDGVDFNFWLLNPLTYFLAKRHRLEVAVYTINHVWLAWCFKLLFPGIWLTTDVPHKMQHLRTFSLRKKKA